MSPIARFFQLIRTERQDLSLLGTYTLLIVVLTLAAPLAIQSLVNTIAAGLFVQPVVVLSLVVFAGLSIAGVMMILQFGVVETLQQRVFAESALRLADRIVHVQSQAMRNQYAPELMNRFFDVLTVQKALSKLFLDGFTAAIQIIVTLVVLGAFNPGLLLSAVVIVALFVGAILLLGFGGIKSSLKESKAKYLVAEWLEDLGRCHVAFKIFGCEKMISERTDELVADYLKARRAHFQVNRRQLGGYFIFNAVVSAGVLGAGAWLVLSGNLTLGQLVAAQIIVSTTLVSLEKLVRQSEKYFDLLAGLDKVAVLTELPIERSEGRPMPASDPCGLSLEIRKLNFAYPNGVEVLRSVNLSVKAGDRISLVGASGAGKSTLASVLSGFYKADTGEILLNGTDLREISLDSLRKEVVVVGYEPEIFHGTIEENIRMGRSEYTSADLRWAIEMAALQEDLTQIPDGLQADLVSSGSNISRGQLQRLLIARAVLGRPKLLILDESFTGIDERIAQQILDNIFDPKNPWTIIDISHQPDVIVRTDTIHVMAKGSIVDTGSPEELARKLDGEFANLFPFLSASLRTGQSRIVGGGF